MEINGGIVCPNPDDNKCICCGKEISHGDYANCYVKIYKEEDRANMLVYRNVKYKQLSVRVTRCKKCKKTQKRASMISFYYSFGIGLIIVALGLILMRSSNALGTLLIIGGVITTILLWLSKGEDREADYLEKKGVLTPENAINKYEEVAELLRSGWTLAEPEP